MKQWQKVMSAFLREISFIKCINTFENNCQEAPLSLSCHVMSFCEWIMPRGGIVTSRRYIGRTSFLFFVSSSFFCWLLFCLGWQLSGCFFFFFPGCGRQHWYIQCPLGVWILIITDALSDYRCWKIARAVRIREWPSDWVLLGLYQYWQQ